MMKRSSLILWILLLASVVASYAAPITDVDNPHNLSSTSNNAVKSADPSVGGTDEICVFCHTPHSAAPQTPLWNRPDPGDMGSFAVYAQPLVIKANPGVSGYDAASPDYPSGASRMCLSCHDGTTSVGVLLDREVTMDGGPATLAKIDLATSHPISFKYDATVLALLGAYQLPSGAIDVPLDSSDRMQCTTCHDPHEDTSGLASYGNLPFWRHQGNAGSYDDVCNDCHTGPTSGTAPPTHNIIP